VPPESTPAAPAGRVAQRRRTRNAIVDATARLLADGRSPSIDQIAAAADVSRRTIYMHFPSLDQLLLDAAAGALAQAGVEAALRHDEPGADAAARVEALLGTLLDEADTLLPLGRQLIALTVTTPREGVGVTRGYRRIGWIEQALQPLRDQLDPEQFDRLVSALALVIGWEAMVVLRDIRGLDPARERTVATWAARTLVQAMLAENPRRG
jgi:AcrR family transcriptional regulator